MCICYDHYTTCVLGRRSCLGALDMFLRRGSEVSISVVKCSVVKCGEV